VFDAEHQTIDDRDATFRVTDGRLAAANAASLGER
jgi:hypothetical protein